MLTTSGRAEQLTSRNGERVMDYLRIARVDHWFKNIFLLPGTALAVFLGAAAVSDILVPTLIALLSTSLLASANYVINELLDAGTDRHHPMKRHRPAAAGRIRPSVAFLEYLLLVALGLGIASTLNGWFVAFSVLFLCMALVYNVRPLRTKDVVYLDVITESFNNPIRLLLGWTAVAYHVLPPSSAMLAYWAGGAFLMAVKRLAEFRFIGDAQVASLYRRSFRGYSEETLLASSFFFALCSAFFLGVFLIKYRIEYLLVFPLLSGLFTWYLVIGLQKASPTQNPEKLYREGRFVTFIVGLCAVIAGLTIVDIPVLNILMEPVQFRTIE